MMKSTVPEIRVRSLNDKIAQPKGDFVLYWMTAFRRTRYNFSLQYARDLALALDRPLVVLEALRVHYRWASVRLHRFVIEGMADNAAAFRDLPAVYWPYVEPKPGVGSGLVEALADRACLVVSDDYPCFFLPTMLKLVARKVSVPFQVVDSNGLMPLAAPERTFTVAHSYRRHMQKTLPEFLQELPEADPLASRSAKKLPTLSELPKDIAKKWPAADLPKLLQDGGLSRMEIDQSVGPGAIRGGAGEAERLLKQFLNKRLNSYDHDRNEPDDYGSSELSPHLHFGHISAHEIFDRLMKCEDWNPTKLKKPNGKVNGFWGVSENTEAFLDQLVTWREIGFNCCYREPNYDRFESLPDWAIQTLNEHASDQRLQTYSLEQFERAETHDEIWNAAQRQLVREGRIHNYMRMLWGKKILHWSESPREALRILIELNNKYALDGRDPNSYSGIFWVLGRYDRAWGPEREIFGKVRYMTSDSTAKKHSLKKYLKRFATF